MRSFPSKHPAETIVLTFKFANVLGGATLTGNPTASAELETGADGGSGVEIVDAQIDSETNVLVAVSGGGNGCFYRITANCNSTNDNIKASVTTRLPVSID